MSKFLWAVSILFSANAMAETTVVCADSYITNSSTSKGYVGAVENLNERLKALTAATRISAPTIAFSSSDSKLVVICVTVTK